MLPFVCGSGPYLSSKSRKKQAGWAPFFLHAFWFLQEYKLRIQHQSCFGPSWMPRPQNYARIFSRCDGGLLPRKKAPGQNKTVVNSFLCTKIQKVPNHYKMHEIDTESPCRRYYTNLRENCFHLVVFNLAEAICWVMHHTGRFVGEDGGNVQCRSEVSFLIH